MERWKDFIKIQAINILFSLASITTKFVSIIWQEKGIFNWEFIGGAAIYLFLLGIYAVCWQKIIKKMDLSSAYLCKGMVIFWSLLWAYLLLNEKITIYNIIGTMIIFIGTTVVIKNE